MTKTLAGIMPTPVLVDPNPATVFTLTAAAAIAVTPGAAEVARIGGLLAEWLRPATGYSLPVVAASDLGSAPTGAIRLALHSADRALGDEGYRLDVMPDGIQLIASAPIGLFRGIQSLRQLLPAAIENPTPQAGPWPVPAGRIVDHPRYSWRGAMLDVVRHFFGVDDVKRFIDILALYKLNVLHLHLTDDQGWRLAIDSWPRLASHGGRSQVGGGAGGHFSQREYTDIVEYAAARYITLVPEIDTPGHVNAALSCYPELNSDGRAPAPYSGIEVGFSSLCTTKEITYSFLDDVIGELAGLTPGPYIHIGGDEALSTADPDYIAFIERLQRIVESHGKQTIGWAELAKARLLAGTVAQYWDINDRGASARAAAAQGARVILSPATRTYLDMKYDEATELGLDWAGCVSVRHAYDWEPEDQSDVPPDLILGVEAALWTETLATRGDVEYMALPRLAGIAEVGWSPAAARNWPGYRQRLAAQGRRWSTRGLNFHRSAEVDWAG